MDSNPPDRFFQPLTEQWLMPTRHISPQSFDEILSELGDDPAIPDPHGIRKPKAQNIPPTPPPQTPKLPLLEGLNPAMKNRNLWIFCGILGGLMLVIGAGFLGLEGFKSDYRLALDQTRHQLDELKIEMAQFRQDLDASEEELYQSMDKLEVSIHSKLVKTEQKVVSTPKLDPHEREIKRWRYLGMAKTESNLQGFFLSSTARFSLGVGNQALGEWRLSETKKDRATISHPNGKTIVLKALRNE